MKFKFKLPLIFVAIYLLVIIPGMMFIRIYIKTGETFMVKTIFGNSIRIEMIVFVLVILGVVFAALAGYLHFYITKPIQILNNRLKCLTIKSPGKSLYSNRKDEIGELYNHFNEMKDRLYQSQKEQRDMIAAIAHDLKTPLTTINGFVELMATQKSLTEKEKQEYYELILKKSKHIHELINGFSSYTKNEIELESIDIKPVEVKKLFENIAAEYEIELSSLDYALTWEHSFKRNQLVMVNEHMIRRVFGNLISNAVRYAGNKDLKVNLTGYTHENNAYFQVEDNGAGVRDEDMSSLFHKFFTVDKSRQNSSGGMGLGLASCKSIIENHNGTICAFKSNHGGLGIRFSLPM